MMRHTKWFSFIPVLLFALFIPISKAKADALGNWTYSQSCQTSGSVEVIDDAIILHGPDGGGCSGAAHWVKIESVIPEGVDTVDFTWAYQTYDGAWYDPPQYAVNGVYVQLTMESNATGSLSIPVVEGDVFAFRQYSTDTCCQAGHLTISNLSLWTSAPSTSSTVTPTTLETETTISETTTTTTTIAETTTTTIAETTTTTTYLPTTTEAPQITTTTLQQASSTSSSSSSSSQPQTTTTLQETTTTTVTPTTIPTTPSTPPTTVFVPTGTTTTIVEEPIEMPQPQEDLPVTTEMPVEPDPTFETPPTTVAKPISQDNDVTVAQLENVVDAVFTENANVEVMSEALKSFVDADLSVRELATVLEAVFDSDLSDEATIELAQQVLDQPLSTEEFKTVLNAIFDEQISDEVLVKTFTAVLDTPLTQESFAEVVNVLSSDAITNDQVAQVVDLIIGQDGGVAPEQAVELVSSAKVLESVSGEQATEVFGSVDEGSLTVENGEQITAAVQEAPVAVRDAFQEEINVFGGVFDGYYPLGSLVDVGTRRVVLAGTGVLISAPVVASRRVRV